MDFCENPLFIVSDHLLDIVDFYGICKKEDLMSELKLAKNVISKRIRSKWPGNVSISIDDIYKIIIDLKEVFPITLSLYELAVVLHVSVHFLLWKE